MKDIVFFTDPHLGLNRASGTTSKSKALYKEKLYEVVMAILEANKDSSVICLGDLFDECHNSEEVIFQGQTVAKRCELVIGGNHDISNKVGDVGSLQLVEEVLEGDVVISSPDPSKPHFRETSIGGIYFYTIPHCLTQSIFEESVIKATAKASKANTEKRVLLLHCNVSTTAGSFGKVEDGGSSLWLTEELQEKALEVFDKILVGHEHEPKELHQGRLVILGNTYPVSYGEIAPRFIYKMNPVTTDLKKVQIYFPELQFLSLDCNKLMELGGELITSVDMVELTGELKRKDMAELARAMVKLWKKNPFLLAVKNSSKLEQQDDATRKTKDVMKTLKQFVEEAAGPAGFAMELKELSDE